MKVHCTRRQVAVGAGVLGAIGLVPSHVTAGLVTPPQVQGPYYPVNQAPDSDLDLTRVNEGADPAEGEAILVRGRILDVESNPINGAIVEVWQANTHGRYAHVKDRNSAPLDPNFIGFGVMETNDEGIYSFKTIKPGPYPLTYLFHQRWRCRHIHFKVSSAGYRSLTTQMYFAGDPLIETDREVAKIPKEHRKLVIAEQRGAADGVSMFDFDLILASV